MSYNNYKGVWVSFKWAKGAPTDAWKEWSDQKDWTMWNTTGEWDGKIWIKTDDLDNVQQLVWDTVRSNKWVEDSKTELAWQI